MGCLFSLFSKSQVLEPHLNLTRYRNIYFCPQDEHIFVPEEDSPSFESVSSSDERQNMFQRQESSTDSTSSVKKRGKSNRSFLGRLSRKSQKNFNQSISVSDSDVNTTTDEEMRDDSKDILGWGDPQNGFDKLMDSQYGRKVFRIFLKKEFSEENIIFWEACISLKSIKDDLQFRDKAERMFKNHLDPASPHEVKDIALIIIFNNLIYI